MPEVKLFFEACEYIFSEMRGYESVICSSVLSALEGKFGDYHRTRRTVGSELEISPFMPFYWGFLAQKVAENVAYIEQLRETQTRSEVMEIIESYRAGIQLRPAHA